MNALNVWNVLVIELIGINIALQVGTKCLTKQQDIREINLVLEYKSRRSTAVSG